jgi:hypothetical protein
MRNDVGGEVGEISVGKRPQCIIAGAVEYVESDVP